MAYLIKCLDKKNSLKIRLSTREKHLKYLKLIDDLLILAGPILDKKNDPIGTILVVNFETIDEVELFLKNDPYNKVGLFEEVDIIKFKRVL
tara:strand:- start:424 stop:696 length:273 start_codon:yes stop_codon:yes gene_type:complete